MGTRDLVVVPSLLGLRAVTAHDVALDARLLAVDQDPSHSPTELGLVRAQDPLPGAHVQEGDRVRIWVDVNPDDGGGGGGGSSPVPDGPRLLEPSGTK